MEIAQQLAGYTLGGADLLSRAMGKKIAARWKPSASVFVEGAARTASTRMAEHHLRCGRQVRLLRLQQEPRRGLRAARLPHGLSQGEPPLEFYAAVMTMEMANQEKLAAYRHEMRGRGIALLPPDVNASLRSSRSRTGRPTASPPRRRALRAWRPSRASAGPPWRHWSPSARPGGPSRAFAISPAGWPARASTAGCSRPWSRPGPWTASMPTARA
jgi:hypothetical protein